MPDDSRRSTDSLITGMAQDIGAIQGTLENALRNQEQINDRLIGLHQKADERMTALDSADPKKMGRVTDLENSRTRAITYLIAATVLGGGVGGTAHEWAQKLLTTLGGQ